MLCNAQPSMRNICASLCCVSRMRNCVFAWQANGSLLGHASQTFLSCQTSMANLAIIQTQTFLHLIKFTSPRSGFRHGRACMHCKYPRIMSGKMRTCDAHFTSHKNLSSMEANTCTNSGHWKKGLFVMRITTHSDIYLLLETCEDAYARASCMVDLVGHDAKAAWSQTFAFFQVVSRHYIYAFDSLPESRTSHRSPAKPR